LFRFVDGELLHNVYEVSRFVDVSKRLEVAIHFVHHIRAENVFQEFVELEKSVWIVRQAKMVFAATVKHDQFLTRRISYFNRQISLFRL